MIVSIVSQGNGTGASTISINIAAQLALSNQSVAVIDACIEPSYVPNFLRESQQITDGFNHSLLDVFGGLCAIEEAAYRIGEHATEESSTYARLKDRPLWFVPLIRNVGDQKRILRDGYDFNNFNKAVQNLRKSFGLNYVLIENQGISDDAMLTTAFSDSVIVVLEPNQKSFQKAAVFVDVARNLDVSDIQLIVNKALVRYDFRQMKEEIEKVYAVPVMAILPFSEDVIALDSTDIFSLKYPDHAWSRTLASASSMLLTLH